ncbi:MAG: aminofutalosine synthase MqnE [Rikenellaceae bacterium]|nr:aminofutalosine synthase MqnE [Rikenellaceae bacterium]
MRSELLKDGTAEIAARVESGGRITPEEALLLWRQAPLAVVGTLADSIKRKKSGDSVYYNRNFHIEPTNICLFRCKFCSYRREEGQTGAWNMTLGEIEDAARKYTDSPVTEVHIVGGVHPAHDLDFYTEMIRRIKVVLPDVTIKAFTAIELAYMIEKAGMDYTTGLRILKNAGMEAIPGGGAEIFDEDIRRRICPEKGSTDRWLEIHESAHNIGLRTNATMLYGHVEGIEHRIDHMERLRTLQDRTGGFDAFIPLKFRSAGNSMENCGEVPVTDDLRTLAMSRIYLDNFPHIKAYWPMYGKTTTEMALSFGADDIDGTIDDTTKIYSMAGAEDLRPVMTVDDIKTLVSAAGYRAVERDTFYNEV